MHIFACHHTHTHTIVPSKPANIKAKAESATSILVEWEKSSGDEGITAHIVEYCKASDFPNFDEREEFSGDACSALLDGLDRTTKYKVRVKVENAQGDGPYSDVVEVSTGAKGEFISFPNGTQC